MSLVVMGASYKSAPISLREKIAVQQSELDALFDGLLGDESIREALVLSTCNRVELYVDANTDRLGAAACARFFESRLGRGCGSPEFYLHRGDQAARHMLRVACSLESQVLGEAQILGQLRRAFGESAGHGASGEVLTKLCKMALELGKRVRAQTGIGTDSVSLSTTAFKAACSEFDGLASCSTLLVGAGEMARLMAKYLADARVGDLTVVSRTLDGALRLAQDFGARAAGIDELYGLLASADLVFTMTSSDTPVICAGALSAALERRDRGQGKLVIIDEAVPRDVESACGEDDRVVLYDQESLSSVVDDGLAVRMGAVAAVERMVDEALEDYLAWMQERLVVPTVKDMYEKGAIVVGDELERARKELEKARGHAVADAELEVLQAYGNAVMKKLLHGPVMRLRKEASNPNSYYCTGAARYLFGLDVFPPGKRRPCSGRNCEKGKPCPIGLEKALQPFCRDVVAAS